MNWLTDNKISLRLDGSFVDWLVTAASGFFRLVLITLETKIDHHHGRRN